MHLEDGLTTLEIWVGDRNLPVEPAGPQQRLVQNVGPVGGGHEDHAFTIAEAIHLDKQLVEGLFPLIVAAAHAGAALATHGINLVDKDNAGAVFPSLLEEVPDPGGAHANKHFHKVGTRNGVERHAGLPGNGAGQEGFTGTRRAIKQHAAGDFRP